MPTALRQQSRRKTGKVQTLQSSEEYKKSVVWS